MWNIWKDKSYDRLKYDMFRKTRWIGINLSLEMWLKNIKPVPCLGIGEYNNGGEKKWIQCIQLYIENGKIIVYITTHI